MDELRKIVEIQWNLKEWGTFRSDSKEQLSICFNMRPLAILSRVLGLFPIENVSTDKACKLKHRTFCILNAYGYILYALLAYLHITSYIYQLKFLRILITCADVLFVADIVVFSLSWNAYITLLSKCDEFDWRFSMLPVKIYTARSKYRRYAFLIPAASVIIILMARNLYVYLKYFSENSENLIYMVTEALIYVPRTVQTSLYAFTCDEISFRFSQLHRSWASYLKYLSDTKANTVCVHLDKYRLLNLHLLTCIRLTDNFFGLRLAMVFLNSFTDTLYYVFCFYYFYSDSFESFFTLYLTILGCIHLSVWMIIWASSELISESQKIKNYIFRILALDMPLVIKIEIDRLLQELQFHKEEVTAWGLFSLSKKLIGSFVLHLTTYFIALSQLTSFINDLEGPYNRSHGYQEWVNETLNSSLPGSVVAPKSTESEI